jgi:histone-arginine methyltransferase CARM1
VLSTSPHNPPTHWYQVRLLLPEPLAINKGKKVYGQLKFKANDKQSYEIKLRVGLPEYNLYVENEYDLKDPEFRGFTNYIYKPSQTQNQNHENIFKK